MSANIWHAITLLLQKNDAVCPPPSTIWCCSLIRSLCFYVLCHCLTTPLSLGLKAITLCWYKWSLCGEFVCGGFPGITAMHPGELQLKPSAFKSPLACVKLVFDSRIIQWAQQEAFIWLSLCFPASAEGANIRDDIGSRSLFCHSRVRGRNESPPGAVTADLLHLYFIFSASTGKEVEAVNSKDTLVHCGGG